ncbi:hypothetical protein HDU96_009257 [Phlyctochytrium bullatum]|nr:hypothetical protein HDU96_009257 [Phlyctochytrium bullatum]
MTNRHTSRDIIAEQILSYLPLGILVLRAGTLDAVRYNAAFVATLSSDPHFANTALDQLLCDGSWIEQCVHPDDRVQLVHALAGSTSEPTVQMITYRVRGATLTAETVAGADPEVGQVRIHTVLSMQPRPAANWPVADPSVTSMLATASRFNHDASLSPSAMRISPEPPPRRSLTMLDRDNASRTRLAPMFDRTSQQFLDHLVQKLREPLCGIVGGALLLEHNLVERQRLLSVASEAAAVLSSSVETATAQPPPHTVPPSSPPSTEESRGRVLRRDADERDRLEDARPRQRRRLSTPQEHQPHRHNMTSWRRAHRHFHQHRAPAALSSSDSSSGSSTAATDSGTDTSETRTVPSTPPPAATSHPVDAGDAIAALRTMTVDPSASVAVTEADLAARTALTAMWEQVAEDEESLRCIHASVLTIKTFADDVLELSRLDAMVEAAAGSSASSTATTPLPAVFSHATLTGERLPMDPKSLLTDAAKEARRAAAACGVSMRLDLPFEAVPECIGDASRLRQALGRIAGDAARRAAAGVKRNLHVRGPGASPASDGVDPAKPDAPPPAAVASVTLFLEVVDSDGARSTPAPGHWTVPAPPPTPASYTSLTPPRAAAAAPPAPPSTLRIRFGARYDTFTPPRSFTFADRVARGRKDAAAVAAAALNMDLNLLIADRLLTLTGAEALNIAVGKSSGGGWAAGGDRVDAVPRAAPELDITPPASPAPCPVAAMSTSPESRARVLPPPPDPVPTCVSFVVEMQIARPVRAVLAAGVEVGLAREVAFAMPAVTAVVQVPTEPVRLPGDAAVKLYPPTRHALIVEDNFVSQRILQRFLQSVGVPSVLADSFETCMEQVSVHCFPADPAAPMDEDEAASDAVALPVPLRPATPPPVSTDCPDASPAPTARPPRVRTLTASTMGDDTPAPQPAGIVDTVFIDIQLAGRPLAGVEAVRAIRAREVRGAGRRLRVVGVAGSSNPRVVREALEAGMDEYVVKPFRREDVVRLVGGEVVGFTL